MTEIPKPLFRDPIHNGAAHPTVIWNRAAGEWWILFANRRLLAPPTDLHEHFVDPCIVADGAYVLPSQAGYSAEMHTRSIAQHRSPGGSYWVSGSTVVEGVS